MISASQSSLLLNDGAADLSCDAIGLVERADGISVSAEEEQRYLVDRVEAGGDKLTGLLSGSVVVRNEGLELVSDSDLLVVLERLD